jgi:hypothetical protein
MAIGEILTELVNIDCFIVVMDIAEAEMVLIQKPDDVMLFILSDDSPIHPAFIFGY